MKARKALEETIVSLQQCIVVVQNKGTLLEKNYESPINVTHNDNIHFTDKEIAKETHWIFKKIKKTNTKMKGERNSVIPVQNQINYIIKSGETQ